MLGSALQFLEHDGGDKGMVTRLNMSEELAVSKLLQLRVIGTYF
jgi:hypothetical protein